MVNRREEEGEKTEQRVFSLYRDGEMRRLKEGEKGENTGLSRKDY